MPIHKFLISPLGGQWALNHLISEPMRQPHTVELVAVADTIEEVAQRGRDIACLYPNHLPVTSPFLTPSGAVNTEYCSRVAEKVAISRAARFQTSYNEEYSRAMKEQLSIARESYDLHWFVMVVTDEYYARSVSTDGALA
jgi:hypothetical protein